MKLAGNRVHTCSVPRNAGACEKKYLWLRRMATQSSALKSTCREPTCTSRERDVKHAPDELNAEIDPDTGEFLMPLVGVLDDPFMV